MPIDGLVPRPLTLARAARAQARLKGDKTYPGQDCALAHGGLRYTSNAQCTACAKAQRADQYARAKDVREHMGAHILDCL